jgi:hypothetical protein
VRTQLTLLPAIRRLGSLAAAVLLSAMVAAGPALAEGHGWGREHGGGGWARGAGAGGAPPGRGYGGAPPARGGVYGPPPVHGGEGRGGERGGGYGAPPARGGGRWGYGPPAEAYGPYPGYSGRAPPSYGLRRGGMIPPEYRGAIVPDYGSHRLRPPPPGFAWVRMGGRYMLVSRSTGQIFDVIGQ